MVKYCVFHATFGQGHAQAAQAIADYLHTPAVDLLGFLPRIPARLLSQGYVWITEHAPLLWHTLFLASRPAPVVRLLQRLHCVWYRGALRFLLRQRPECLITTHFFPVGLAAEAKKYLPHMRIIVVVTDLRVHPLWHHDKVDRYYVAHPQGREDLIRRGVRPDKISCGYVPVRAQFFTGCDAGQLRIRYGIDHRPCVLLVSSLSGRFPEVEKLITELKDQYNLFIIYGRNRRMCRKLQRFKSKGVRLFRFHSRIWELMTLARIIVTKPGGLTLFEGMVKRAYFVFPEYIPGQEYENLQLITDYGIAEYAPDVHSIIAAIRKFSGGPSEKYPLQVKDIRPEIRGAQRS
ncbi:MAG: hypothetical protein GF333_02730 [Candidatus Omnitrophica bacterium]|nr:hypothetical protein [Candidatus Omnitrophota bacterium]